ncbi:helix-turn-helix domain-containing protein [Spirosoma sp. KUDC1026]|uniref:helix-turn-helix domain-containing protein n=1 Tax=Spirosoma sp. KUDC1026 TaxID=2745947 RepID=UPI00159BCF82|nr:helix-turn-helix domain-containing protein [Spirosoma sp. KUDC1026]QKZ15908.1 helix-turn-helix domain-containing protein [Spirosoma sp. KUDC1026]
MTIHFLTIAIDHLSELRAQRDALDLRITKLTDLIGSYEQVPVKEKVTPTWPIEVDEPIATRSRRPQKRFSDDELSLIRRMHDEGKTQREIGLATGRSHVVICVKLKQMGLDKQSEKPGKYVEPFGVVDCLEMVWEDRLKVRNDVYLLDGEPIVKLDLAKRTNKELEKTGQPSFDFPNDWKDPIR